MNLTDMTWPQVRALSPDTPVVIPVAALEQHGHHLPLFTDSMLLGEVIRRVSVTMHDQVLFTPLMWLGNSHHHMEFPGTLSAEPRLYLDLLNNLAENLLKHGFRRLVFINGHGGNDNPGKQAIFELRQRHRLRDDLLLLFTTYWDHSKPREGRDDFVQDWMGHACEWETSMILKLAPHLVGEIANLEDIPSAYGFGRAYRGWIMSERTTPGHIGMPRHATAEKGEYLFTSFATGVEQFLQKVIDWSGRGW
ncbi:MAG: creatininase family protein [Planctomycetaceae bacterium]